MSFKISTNTDPSTWTYARCSLAGAIKHNLVWNDVYEVAAWSFYSGDIQISTADGYLWCHHSDFEPMDYVEDEPDQDVDARLKRLRDENLRYWFRGEE